MTNDDVVVVLPGIMGSTLGIAEHGRPASDKEVWGVSRGAIWRGLTSRGRSIADLALPEGIGDDHPGDGVEPLALMPTVHAVPGLWTPIHGYSGLLCRLRELGYTDATPERPGNLVPFPYDWRLSNRHNGRRLKGVAESALARWRSQGGRYADAELILVCHSMGGLVARWYLEQEGGAELTRKLVTLGTPWRGSVNAVQNVLEGPGGKIGLVRDRLLPFVRSLPSIYQLMPTYACVERGTRLLTLTEAPLADLDARRVADAAAFFATLEASESARPEIDATHHALVGVRQPSRTSIRDGDRVSYGETLAGQDHLGDGTVPLPGALPVGTAADSNRIRRVADQHGHLQENDAMLVEVESILTASPALFRGEGGHVRVESPDLVTTDEALVVSVALDDGGQVGLEVTAQPEQGPPETVRPVIRKGRGEAIFEDLPPGIVTLTVAGVQLGAVEPVTAATLVWDVETG